MLIALNIVQNKHRPVAWRQLRYRVLKRELVDHRDSPGALQWRFDDIGEVALLARMLELNPALAEVHQHLIHGQPVQPGREGRLAAKASDLLVDLQEDLLSKIFR